jgi:predicted O-methyltransferase YrrM
MGRYGYLTSTVKKYKAKTILEIGTWNGAHAIKMIREARALDSSADITYYGFDVWEQMDKQLHTHEVSKWPPAKSKVERVLNDSGAKINLIQGNTLDTLPTFVKDNKDLTIDFIFIDGGHSFETIESDWNNVQNLIDENTVIIFDDYWYPPNGKEPHFGCSKIIDSLDRDKWQVTELPNSDTFPTHGRVHFVEVKMK